MAKTKKRKAKTLIMKQKTLKRVTLSILVTLLVASMTLAFSASMVKEVAAAVAAPDTSYITLFDKNINTNKEQFYDNSVIYKLPDTVKDTDIISLIVEVPQAPLLETYKTANTDMSFSEYAVSDEAEEIRSNILSLKNELISDLEGTDIEYGSGASYASILSGFEISIKAADFEQTCKLFGDRANVIVSEVYKPAETKLVENEVNVYDTGIFDSSKFGYDGTGMVVAVLDTGIDYGHSAFSLENFTADRSKLGLTFEQISALMANNSFASERLYNGLTASDVYINEKIPFGFDYADYDPDVFPIKSDHGTHVSGIIAGKDDTITGVAPNAQLVEMKIFSDVQDSAIASWILTAVEDCVLLGVDVINMSIGTSCGFSRETDKEAMSGVYDRVREAGISLIVAASNSYNSTYGSEKNGNLGLTSNPDSGTVGSPSTYAGALSIASISGKKTPYLLYNDKIVYFTESSDKYSEEKNFLDDILPEGVNEKEFEYVTIPGVGRRADYTGVDVTGKIVLVKRGDTTFEEKANIAQEKGAVGIIVYNNVSGEIKMNVGSITIAACSIGQDDGEALAASASGKIKVSRSQTSGPFMSDFSSWGPTPDLKLKPELTAHGGSILSSVPGQAYDRISGTSMACPNIAGATALLRQYIINRFPEYKDNNVKIAEIANRLFMSTADIITNKNGLPYSVRKQGAGLANLDNSAKTNAYIITYDENGQATDKTKIELGDDPSKAGVYTLKFSVCNFGSTTLTYDISTYVLTEGVSDTKTNDGKTTVTEEAYELKDAVISIASAGANGNTLSVSAGQTVDVTVTVTLGAGDKEYLDKSFENGMYVEGFVVLDAKEENSVDLSVPYLAFYGDWTKAPLFDLDYFQTNKDELDDSISLLDKTLPDAYATRPIGGLNSDYVNYLGSYYFTQNPATTPIAADRKYISLSNQDDAVNSLRFVWAGMLRSAERIEITITEDATGKVIFSKTESDIRKSYGDGGSIYPANVKIEFSAIENQLKNNTKYTVKLKGYLDYGDGGENSNLNNEFEFPLVTDFQAPAATDCQFYTEYDKATEKTRLFAKVAIYDNHYAMSAQFGYVEYDPSDTEVPFTFQTFDKYMTPIYSEEDSVSYVVYELTDYIYQIKNNAYNKNTLAIAVYDYALNQATYEIELPDEISDLYFEEEEITLSPNEIFDLKPLIYPNTKWSELLQFTVTIPPTGEVARIVNNKLVAIAPGKCKVIATARDPITNKQKQASFILTVLGEDDEGYVEYDKTVTDNFFLSGYYVNKAFYMLNTEDRDVGVTGDNMKFGSSNYSLAMFPSEAVTLQYVLDAYYPAETDVVFKSSNDKIATVDENGKITAVAEGFASISVNVLLDGKSTYYSQSISIEVKNPFLNTGPSLTHYFGNGGTVEFPDSVAVTEIGQFAFSNFDYIAKDPAMGDIINDDYPELTKIWFIGDKDVTEGEKIKKVIIPLGVEKIGSYAFAGLVELEEVVIPHTVTMIDQGAFYGCTSLSKISYMDENGEIHSDNGLKYVKLINQSAFENTNLNGTYNLESAVAIASYAFRNCKNLDGIILGKNTVSVGDYAFASNVSLEKLTFEASKTKLGVYAFSGCSSLESVTLNTEVIPTGLFSGASALTEINLGASIAVIGEYAFAGTDIDTITIDAANKFFAVRDKYIVNTTGDTLVLVMPYIKGNFTLNDPAITKIGNGAFSGNKAITSVSMPYATSVGDFAFARCSSLASVELASTLTYIGDYAFYNTEISSLPSFAGVSSIGNYAFAGTNIENVNVPSGVKIGNSAFANCLVLENITIGNDVEIGNFAFGLVTSDNWSLVKGADGNYRYVFASPIHSLTIGDNAVIGDRAFYGACELESITLGQGAVIGEYAFYNTSKLTSIDGLSKALSIGAFAFNGDVYNIFTDSSAQSMLIDENNEYVYAYYSSAFTSIDLSAATSIGESSFAGCVNLESVTLGNAIKDIPNTAFIGCTVLTDIDLSGIETIGDSAFARTALTAVDISAATTVGSYAFAYCPELISVKFNENGVTLAEGAFAESSKLATLTNLNKVTEIGDYAFAYTSVTVADLSNATSIGSHAFIKKTMTDFTVVLGDALESIGDNPFAYCNIAPFSSYEKVEFNGSEYLIPTYTYDINDYVKVINGSLYTVVPNGGLELICFAGIDSTEFVADNTVRITAYAFAGTNVSSVVLPYTVHSIGHKAFFDCNNLTSVTFTSYDAPILEEEYDFDYYYSYDNIPASGSFGFIDTDGVTEIYKDGLGIIPYYMWNVSSLPNNFFYGANFVDYIGHVNTNVVMIRPSNGINYDSFVLNQYFSGVINGKAAADEITLNAIKVINSLPETILLSHKSLVEAARAAYNLVTTVEQQSLVTNYSILTNAERRIQDLEYLQNQQPEEPTDDPIEQPTETPTEPITNTAAPKTSLSGEKIAIIAMSAGLAILLALAIVFMILYIKSKKNNSSDSAEENAEDALISDANAEDALISDANGEEAVDTESEAAASTDEIATDESTENTVAEPTAENDESAEEQAIENTEPDNTAEN
ncbi:MAG: hypothetical protein E7667_00910 [Ruminococcaceae bacterium]|nr:hypothetical protein [Oscillospiraceae bacterium]